MKRAHLALSAALMALGGCATVKQAASAPPVCSGCPDMAVISPASFQMGEYRDYGYGPMDGPTHNVTFTKPFAIARHEVTLGEFRKFVAETGHRSEGICNVYEKDANWHVDPKRNWADPGFRQDENHPVVCVSWNDTQAYIAWLNKKTGQSYRLPNEAEWEFISSQGGVGSGSDGAVTHDDANIGKPECCGGETGGHDVWIRTAPVGSFAKDRSGLYDVRGNVWEWMADCYEPTYEGAPVDGTERRLCKAMTHAPIRGGSYGDSAEYQSSKIRLRGPLGEGYFTTGFRLALSMP